MPEKSYDYKALIDAYIESERYKNAHPNLKNYSAGLFEALKKLFNITFDEFEWKSSLAIKPYIKILEEEFGFTSRASLPSPEDEFPPPLYEFKNDALRLLDNTISFYNRLYTPVSGQLEGTYGYWTLWHIFGKDITRLHVEQLAAYEKVIEGLFKFLYGDVTAVFHSADLKAIGFDDSNPPNPDFF